MPTVITVCDTCKTHTSLEQSTPEKDGAQLAALIEAAAEGNEKVIVRRHSCLMGCQQGCNIALQADDKLTYVMGRFEPNEDAANGIVEYATLHSESASGQVPFKQWPQAVKGHFVSRIPVLNTDNT